MHIVATICTQLVMCKFPVGRVTREDGSQPVSTFYFGDFNFRLDLQNVVKVRLLVCSDG